MSNSVVIIIVVVFVLIVASMLTVNTASHSHPILDQVRANLGKIDPKFSTIPLRIGEDAHTKNKNLIVLCIEDENGKYYDINTLMYVAIHEVAHVISISDGHTDEFKQNFSMLLQKAIAVRVFDQTKFIPSTYCGVRNR